MVGTSFGDWCRYFQYSEGSREEDKEKNKTEARNVLLVVAVLIAAVTFQAGVNPPGDVSNSSAYYVFFAFNTLSFSAAVLVIMSLTHKFPFKVEVRVSAVSMIITYGPAVFAVTGDDANTFQFILIIAAAPLVLRCLIQLFVKWINREPEHPCLIQAFVKPKNKTTDESEIKPEPAGTNVTP